jgi:psp operon transcriptional activator PspF
MDYEIVAVDDQIEVRELLVDIFTLQKKTIHVFAGATEALALIAQKKDRVGLVILDLDLGPNQLSGQEILKQLGELYPGLPVIILTGKGSVAAAVSALKAGATDFIEKDFYLEDKISLSVEKVEIMLHAVRQQKVLNAQNQRLRAEVQRLGGGHQIISGSQVMAELMEKVIRVAPLPRPLLIIGERGTGKELVAHALHFHSQRADDPFVVMNCAAVAETLLESELFGHEKGAFTGATGRKEGKFELADGGTLFLDEIGNMSLEFQAKILRVLEYQRFQRVGGSKELSVDVRVIAATNRDLNEAMDAGEFRRDLYDRLAFEVLNLPPLRERREDIPRIAEFLLRRFAAEVGSIRCSRMSKEAALQIMSYDFPGNIRELKNVIERAAYRAESDELGVEDIRAAMPNVGHTSEPKVDVGDFETRVADFESRLALSALEDRDWNQKDAAEILGLTYDQFRHLYRKYKLGSLRQVDDDPSRR